MKLNYLRDLTDKKRRRKIHSIFTWSVFLILIATYLVVITSLFILVELDVLHVEMLSLSTWLLMLIFLVASSVIGYILSILATKFVLGEVNMVVEGMSELAKGNFDVKIELGKNAESKQLAQGFNNLAEELKASRF